MTSTIPQVITKKELRLMVPYSPQHIARLEKAGQFPKRIAIGKRRVGWWLSEVQAWLNERSQGGEVMPIKRKRPCQLSSHS